MAGVSRQAVSAVESGQSDPSLRVALALAQALGLTVDELFSSPGAVPAIRARPVGPASRSGDRVTLAQVAGGFVALPLAGATVSRSGFLPAGGLVAADQEAGRGPQPVQVRPLGPARPTLVVAGCDPALPLLAEPLGLLDPPIALSWWPCASQEALRLAAAGLVHVAGVHLGWPAGGYQAGPATESLASGGGGEVFGFSAWREGLVLRPADASRVGGVGDAVAAGLRLVNREPGAQARAVLDRELAELGVGPDQVAGYETTAAGHLQVAEAVAGRLADTGVASEPAALAYQLAFVPLTAERFDLVIPAGRMASREVQALLKVLSSRWLLDQLGSLPGYDPGPCGQHLATLSAAS
jgi:putative molybdopterin biosynthesis protein